MAAARSVTLPEGADQLDELPIRFPRTPEGAAAAEATKNRYGGLDYEFALQVMRTYVAPNLAATYEHHR